MALFQRLKKQFHTDQSGQLKQELQWLWTQVCRYRGRILAVGLLGVLGTVMGLASSVASKYLIDAVTGGRADLLAGAAIAMVALMLLSLALHGISSRVGARIHIRVKNALQRTAFGKILRAGWESLEQYRSGDLLNRLSADVDAVCGGIINFLPSLAGSGVKFLGAFGIMLFYDPVMAVIALLGVPVTLLASRLLLGKMRDHNLKMKTLSGDVMAFQEDSFRNLTSIKAFSLTDRFENRMRGLQGTYSDAYLSYNAFHIGTSTMLAVVSMTVTVSCFGWGVYQLWNGSITYGSMTMFLQLASTLRGAFQSMVSLVQQGVSLTTSAGRILAVEALPEESAALPAGLDAESRLDIRLEQVSFRYRDGDPVLEPFDFTARHGDVIAITGPSGEGKTTLLRLLLGLVQPTSGTAALHGASGAVYPLNAGTRRMFAYVPQGNSVFSGTIAENLRLVCPDATDAQLEEALRIACAWEFVSRFPDGMEHRLESGGRGVSEGQAQRLAIARALLRKAPVLLLDEVTSGLDAATERQLLENLRTCGWLQTCILVTHRAESAAFCSRCYELSSRLLTEKPVSDPGDFM